MSRKFRVENTATAAFNSLTRKIRRSGSNRRLNCALSEAANRVHLICLPKNFYGGKPCRFTDSFVILAAYLSRGPTIYADRIRREEPGSMTSKEVLEFAKKNEVKELDLRFTDLAGADATHFLSHQHARGRFI